MNCQDFQEHLERSIDECRVASPLELSGDELTSLLTEHAGDCPSCRTLLDQQQLLDAAIVQWKPRKPSVNLSDRVLAAMREDMPANHSKPSSGSLKPTVISKPQEKGGTAGLSSSEHVPRRNFWPTVVTVALVLAAVAVVFRDRPNQQAENSPPPNGIFEKERPEQKLDGSEQIADIRHLIADAQSAWFGIANRASSRASGLSVFVPDLNTELGITEVSRTLDGSPDGESNPTDSESAGDSGDEPSAVQKTFEFLFDQATPADSVTI